MLASIINIAEKIWEALPVIASWLIVVQLFFLKRQITQDHERSRRENTVKFLSEWCLALREETNVAEAIAQELSIEDCRHLYHREPFEIKEELFHMLSGICPSGTNVPKNGKYIVEGEPLNILRWHVMSYLNILETTLLAWKLGIVERGEIEHQFSFLCDDTQGRDFLHNMRKVADGYPTIDEFMEKLIKNKKDSYAKPYSELASPKKKQLITR